MINNKNDFKKKKRTVDYPMLQTRINDSSLCSAVTLILSLTVCKKEALSPCLVGCFKYYVRIWMAKYSEQVKVSTFYVPCN